MIICNLFYFCIKQQQIQIVNYASIYFNFKNFIDNWFFTFCLLKQYKNNDCHFTVATCLSSNFLLKKKTLLTQIFCYKMDIVIIFASYNLSITKYV